MHWNFLVFRSLYYKNIQTKSSAGFHKQSDITSKNTYENKLLYFVSQMLYRMLYRVQHIQVSFYKTLSPIGLISLSLFESFDGHPQTGPTFFTSLYFRLLTAAPSNAPGRKSRKAPWNEG